MGITWDYIDNHPKSNTMAVSSLSVNRSGDDAVENLEIHPGPRWFPLEEKPRLHQLWQWTTKQIQAFRTGWWLGHPSEKYERQLGWLATQY